MVIQHIELRFSSYSTTNAATRSEQIRQAIQQCMRFKRCLERQEFPYHFSRSEPGTGFNPTSMHSITGSKGPGSVVLFSLFPSLWRNIGEGTDQLIAQEQVWVRCGQPANGEA